jgi:MarR family 2-MHQ and catechol resistance regulon transcriptional repressor
VSEQDLIPEEADVLARVGSLPVDLGALGVCANIWRAAQRLRTYLEREVLRDADVSWTGFAMLFNLWVWGAMETRALATSMAVTRATVSGVADTLERRGHVRRAGDPDDRRLVRLELTPAGRRMIEALFPRVNEGEAALVGGLSRVEQATLAGLLRRFVTDAKEAA